MTRSVRDGCHYFLLSKAFFLQSTGFTLLTNRSNLRSKQKLRKAESKALPRRFCLVEGVRMCPLLMEDPSQIPRYCLVHSGILATQSCHIVSGSHLNTLGLWCNEIQKPLTPRALSHANSSGNAAIVDMCTQSGTSGGR